MEVLDVETQCDAKIIKREIDVTHMETDRESDATDQEANINSECMLKAFEVE